MFWSCCRAPEINKFGGKYIINIENGQRKTWWVDGERGLKDLGSNCPFCASPASLDLLWILIKPHYLSRGNCDQLNCLWFHSYKDKIHVCLWISNLLRHSGVRIKDEWMAAHKFCWWWLRLDWRWLGQKISQAKIVSSRDSWYIWWLLDITSLCICCIFVIVSFVWQNTDDATRQSVGWPSSIK